MKREQGNYRIDYCPAKIRRFFDFHFCFLCFFTLEVFMKMVQKFVVALIAVVGFVACQSSLAQVVPIRSSGVDNTFNPSTGAANGNSITSHMGRTITSGFASFVPLTPTPDPVTGEWVFAWELGTGEFVARNGDKIFLRTDPIDPLNPSSSVNKVYVDTTNAPFNTAVWRGKIIVTGGTGRFDNVGPGTAPLDFTAINHPFQFSDPVWLYDYTTTGDIDLGRK